MRKNNKTGHMAPGLIFGGYGLALALCAWAAQNADGADPLRMGLGAALSAALFGSGLWALAQERGRSETENRQAAEEKEQAQKALALLHGEIEGGKQMLEREARLRAVVSGELQKEKEVAQNYLEMANMVMAALDADGCVEMINRKGLELMGFDERDILGESFARQAVAEGEADEVEAEILGVLRAEKELSLQSEFCVRSPGGIRRVLWANALLRSEAGQIRGLLLCGEDVTERREQEGRLHLMRRMLESIDEGVVAFDQRGRVIWSNPSCERITGYCEKQLCGKPIGMLYPTSQGVMALKGATEALKQNGYWRGEMPARTSQGHSYPQKLSLAQVRSGEGGLQEQSGYTVAVFSDITEEKKREEHINYLANHDTLTRLPNRAAFSSALDASIERAKRKPGTKVAVMFIDLDHFKKVNDTLGHAIGDKLLIEVAERLKDSLRHGDFISRLGGDEFTVIIENLKTAKDAETSAKKILENLSRNYASLGEHEIRVTPSIGICLYPDDAMDTQSLIKRSDQAMYQAKNHGRGTLRFFSPEINAQDIEHLMLENRLRKALESRSIQLFYQPKVEFRTGKLKGFEALARWMDPVNGYMSPEVFIPIAEETGLIMELGQWALREACTQLALWQMNGHSDLEMAVNLSPLQFRDGDLISELSVIIEETGINPACLQLELTETALTHDNEGTKRILGQLKGLGVSLAIDDFGTGHSSLARLKDMPVDVLKIDKSFVDGVPGDQSSEAICKAVVGLGRSMGMKIVAEGVETEKQAEFLAAAGADQAQGYLYSKPMSHADMELLLNKTGGVFAMKF